MKKLKVGDKVRLNSGSPLLTVSSAKAGLDNVTVVWINEQGLPQSMTLNAACFFSCDDFVHGQMVPMPEGSS